MRCVQTLAHQPVRASQRLSSAPKVVQKAVSVMMASYSMDICVFKRRSVAAMTKEEPTRYIQHFSHGNIVAFVFPTGIDIVYSDDRYCICVVDFSCDLI